MKILVLGAGGMAGYGITSYLIKNEHEIIGFSRKKLNYCKFICGDIKEKDFIINVIKNEKFDAIVNCIGVLNDFAESNKVDAVYLNSYLPHFLAEITKNLNTQIIHLSTDCVFSGKKGNYSEKDFRDGDHFYDRSKALGETKYGTL